MKLLLNDVWALETMLRRGHIESGVRRIGAEQEMVLVEGAYRPSFTNLAVLERVKDPAFTTELARFNVELNLPALDLGGDCFHQVEEHLTQKVEKLRGVVNELGADVLLCGILPTLRVQDISLDAMTPMERYRALNDALSRLRGDAYELRINGADELILRHDTVMLEACNTSFQVHLQVDPDNFARAYNLAQLLAAPTLAAATNSPLLFGRKLWKETRVAVFQQAVDTRTSSYYLQEHSSRVNFGRRWVQRSALELFQEDIARFRVLLGMNEDHDPFAEINAGRPPKLKALQLHNSTVYRWNRACYGITDGKAHLRIENRVLPAGPTIVDQVANMAFWIGLMQAGQEAYGDIKPRLDFDHARSNFVTAARRGLGAMLNWLDGRLVPVRELILQELLPLARKGLKDSGVRAEDAERYLGIIEARVTKGQTGADWQLGSLEAMHGRGTMSQQLAAITATTLARQKEGTPVHEWGPAHLTAGASASKHAYMRVEQIMTTDTVTVNQEELLELVARIMDWNNIRYVPVEDDKLNLVGLVSHRALLRYLARDVNNPADRHVPVRQIMHKLENELYTVTPHTLTLDALELMRTHRVGCLPVVQDGRLIGMVTERNFMTIAGQLLEQQLRS